MPVAASHVRDPATNCSMISAPAPIPGGQSPKIIKCEQGALLNLLYRAKCKMPWHSPLDRTRTLDNKENPSNQAVPPRQVGFDKKKQALLDGVRATLKNYGAQTVFKFCQAKGAFNKQIMLHSKTQAGACKPLCDHWMVSHAKGHSLFDELYTKGQKGQFKIDTLVSIKQLEIDTMSRKASQAQISHDWLMARGLEASPDVVGGAIGKGNVDVFLDCLLHDSRNQYKSISLRAGLAGHAVVVHVDKMGVTRFFDPNFGDFKFPHESTFKLWFKNEFWAREPYSCAKQFSILSYTASTSLQPPAGARHPGKAPV